MGQTALGTTFWTPAPRHRGTSPELEQSGRDSRGAERFRVPGIIAAGALGDSKTAGQRLVAVTRKWPGRSPDRRDAGRDGPRSLPGVPERDSPYRLCQVLDKRVSTLYKGYCSSV